MGICNVWYIENRTVRSNKSLFTIKLTRNMYWNAIDHGNRNYHIHIQHITLYAQIPVQSWEPVICLWLNFPSEFTLLKTNFIS